MSHQAKRVRKVASNGTMRHGGRIPDRIPNNQPVRFKVINGDLPPTETTLGDLYAYDRSGAIAMARIKFKDVKNVAVQGDNKMPALQRGYR